MPQHILAPSAVACDILHLHASAHLRHAVPFYFIGSSFGISYEIKKTVVAGINNMSLTTVFYIKMSETHFPQISDISSY